MKGVLWDTNGIAELTRDNPESNVVAFQGNAWLSVIALHALEFDLQRLPLGARPCGIR